MDYNISFDISAIIILFIIFLFHRLQYSNDIRSNVIFRQMIIALLVGAIIDIISSESIIYNEVIGENPLYFINILYFLFLPVGSIYLMVYVNAYFEDNKRFSKLYVINRLVLILYYAIVITTPWTHYIFYFDLNLEYLHGPLHSTIYAIQIYYVVEALIILIMKKHELAKKSFLSVLIFTFIIEASTLAQALLIPWLLITYFAAAVAVLILLFSMETPDYQNLIATMEALDNAKEEANHANDAKSQFLANMSHEIRTPINGILGIDEIAITECNDPAITKYLYDIRDAGKSLLTIINDILDFSKIESGKMEIVPVEYNPFDILYSVNNIVAPKAKSKGLDLKIINDPGLPQRLYGDEIRVQQIIINFLNNAIKYTKEGSVTLMLKYARIDDENVSLIISVKDTGIGIRAEDKAKLFETFQRIDLQQNRTIEGTGLGLALTKQLLTLMGGNVDVRSKYGQGSEFIADFPQKVVEWNPSGKFDPNAHEVQEDIKDIVISVPNTKILVVDDVLMNLKVFEGLLKNTGAIVTTATSGMDCLKLQRENKYDLIFLDHMMPEMDGIETFKKMREDENSLNKDTPVIMLTANAISGSREQYLSQGLDDYLSKPIGKQELYKMISKYVKSAAVGKAQKEKSYIDHVKDFVNNDKRENLLEAIEDQDLEKYSSELELVIKMAHNVGSSELAEMGEKLLVRAKAGHYETIFSMNSDFMSKYSGVIEKLEYVAKVQ